MTERGRFLGYEFLTGFASKSPILQKIEFRPIFVAGFEKGRVLAVTERGLFSGHEFLDRHKKSNNLENFV